MTVTNSGPDITIQNNPNCPCGIMECVKGTATGVWITRMGIPSTPLGIMISLTSKLDLEVCADGSTSKPESHDISTTFGIYDDEYKPRLWKDDFAEYADWTTGEIYLEPPPGIEVYK